MNKLYEITVTKEEFGKKPRINGGSSSPGGDAQYDRNTP